MTTRSFLPSWITRAARSAGMGAEVVAASIVITIVLIAILPLPLWLLDVLIAVNICLSAFLMVLVIQLKESVGLSTFPTLLLITTLFRLSLAVASTRLILLEGEAGHIIQAFGDVVVGGNVVVGMVIFLILTVVQFLVITKGAERVAEVGARFALDAMPGKQMSIEMEMRAGTIDATQAMHRRAALAQESQFFGSMDGAMKFVKGDAIAGIIIIIFNLIGGMGVGILQRGMTASEALHTYSILTIGDGLVAQLPALLISMTAGLLVTRVKNADKAESSNVGKELAGQLLGAPSAWTTAGAAMLVFGFIPGMPTVVFLALGGTASFFGASRILARRRETQLEAVRGSGKVENSSEFDLVLPFSIRYSTHQLSNSPLGTELTNRLRQARNDIVARYGMMLPPLEADIGLQGEGADFSLCVNDVPLFSMPLNTSARIVECEREVLEKLEIQPLWIDRTVGGGYIWVRAQDAEKWSADLGPSQDFWSYVTFRVVMAMHKFGPACFGIQEAQKINRWLSTKYPDLGKELERTVPAARLADVMQRILSEKVSIRNIKTIAETLVDWGQRERSPEVLAECVRTALSREICSVNACNGILFAYVLDPETEIQIRDSIRQTAYGNFLALDGETSDRILGGFADALMRDSGHHRDSVVILSSPDIRVYVRKLFADRFPGTSVLSTSELAPEFSVQVLGVVA